MGKSDTGDAHGRHARRKNCAALLWSVFPLGGNPSAQSARTSPRLATRGATRGRAHSTPRAPLPPRAAPGSPGTTFGHYTSPRPPSAFSPPSPGHEHLPHSGAWSARRHAPLSTATEIARCSLTTLPPPTTPPL